MNTFRLPNITGKNTDEQVSQISTYLYQLVEQLNVLQNVDSDSQNTIKTVIAGENKQISAEETRNTFSAIKSLIIKSADIVTSFYEEVIEKLNGEYFADSDFGTYIKNTSATLIKNSEDISANFIKIEEIDQNFDGIVDMLRETSAYIKVGDLGDGIYGVEVGQTTLNENEETLFNKFARFTAEGLYFYSVNTDPIAWMEGGFLYIQKAVITQSIQLGDFYIDTTDGFALIPIVDLAGG